jgi:hypothetical protein
VPQPELEAKLRERLGDALDARAAQVQEEFGGLLDREAALLLLADEQGLLPTQTDLAAFGIDAPPERDLEGVLERLTQTRTFHRQDGSVGFVADADVRTPDGLARVTLWDGPVRQIQGKLGQRVRLTQLVERTRGAERALHTTRGTQVERA